MNKNIFLLLACAMTTQVYAYDFQLDGIYYKIDGNAVCVTYGEFDILSHYGDNTEYPKPNNYDGDVAIPSSVTYEGTEFPVTAIDDRTFWMCYDLTSVSIPSSVTKIGDYAFYQCYMLQSIRFPDSVDTMGEHVFAGCDNMEAFYGKYASEDNRLLVIDGEIKHFAGHGLESYCIPDNIMTIGHSAFASCGLVSIEIPNSVTAIKNCAFSYCTKLESIKIPGSVIEIGYGAFWHCWSLEEFTLPESLSSIGGSCFYDCRKLQSVTIPNSVESIGHHAFNECGSLGSITIPESVTSIGREAFSNCASLKQVTVESVKPYNISLSPDIFAKCNFEECILRVPIGSKRLYEKAPQWKDFKNLEEIPPAGLSILETDTDQSPVVYDLTGARAQMPQDGRIYIVNGKKSLFRK